MHTKKLRDEPTAGLKVKVGCELHFGKTGKVLAMGRGVDDSTPLCQLTFGPIGLMILAAPGPPVLL